jgi:hypothetical protein
MPHAKPPSIEEVTERSFGESRRSSGIGSAEAALPELASLCRERGFSPGAMV